MTNVIIFGTGNISQIAKYYLENDEEYNVVAFTMDKEYISKNFYENLPVIPFESITTVFPPNENKIFIPLSYSKINTLREKKYNEAKAKGYSFISYISPQASIANNANIGENCFIFEDNTIQPYVTIKNNCILWSGNHIGHHSIINENCFIASHAVISGGVTIGRNTFIGVNATIRDHVSISSFNVIGAGTLILKDTKENEVYMEKSTPPSRVPSNRIRGI